MFCLTDNGCRACIASALSTYYRVAYKRNLDVTWHTLDIQLFTWVFLPSSSQNSFRVTNDSCVEMFVGVICACLPSFFKMLHHHEPQIHTFKKRCSSFFHRIRSTLTRSEGKATSSDDASSRKKTYRTLGFVPPNNVIVSTFIGRGHRTPVLEDGIHLKHEVEQREHRADV